jgi:tetratricopeptide (TPR) repeat protein
MWNALNSIGNLYTHQGKLKEAEEMYQRDLEDKKKALGPDHSSTLDTVNNLGILYFRQGKLKEAEEMYQRALAGKEKALGPDRSKTPTAANNPLSLTTVPFALIKIPLVTQALLPRLHRTSC